MVFTQPCGKFPEMPQLAKVNAEFEKTMVVQRQRGETFFIGHTRWVGLNCEIVCTDSHDTTVSDPVEQPLIPAVKHGAGIGENLSVWLFVHRQNKVGKASVEAKKVP